MSTRVQVILDDYERAAFTRRAAAEGVSLSAWLRDAGRRRLEQADPAPLASVDALRRFFARLPEADEGREPDWEEHRRTIDMSRREGLTPT